MAQFVGRWKMESYDPNIEEFMTASNTPDAMKSVLISEFAKGSTFMYDYSRTGTTWNMKTITPFGELENTFPEGQPTASKLVDGRDVTTVITVDGNKLVEKATGVDVTVVAERTVSGDTMTSKYSCKIM
ncbi:fatty acid-binding protein type 2 [Aplysia californica]|uniref:Fatty acid-binding protein type 2 n=1 Tax=Aplysia californica TaxID=6500 RepID=A0ABM0JUB6_APLCA|nr:fatty acid-binding protein type 2 [Aplysia californica]